MISKATVDDIPAMNILVNSAYRGESSKKGWTTEEHLLGGIRTDENGLMELMLNPANIFLKYTDGPSLIAIVLLEKQINSLYLGMLTVLPELQGGGYGRKLLQAADSFAKEHNLPKIVMTVISVRTELIAWYERNGYQPTGKKKPFPMNDPRFGEPKQFLEFIVLEKKIA